MVVYANLWLCASVQLCLLCGGGVGETCSWSVVANHGWAPSHVKWRALHHTALSPLLKALSNLEVPESE